jgi:hypothetical protein
MEQFLIAADSPPPKIESVTGEYELLIHFAANLGRTKSSTSEAAKCFMRLNFPKLSKPGSPAKIGASHCQGDDGTRFVNLIRTLGSKFCWYRIGLDAEARQSNGTW